MIPAIVEAVGSVLGYLSARGVDAVIGKWLAYFTIAWEQRASDKAKLAFDQAMRDIKENLPEKAKAWDDWRKRATLPARTETIPGQPTG